MSAATTAAPRFPKLKLGNWATWEADMSAHLRSKGLMGHVTGLIKAPIVPPVSDKNESLIIAQENRLYEHNIAKDRAGGEIYLMLEDAEKPLVRDLQSSPQEMWDKLKKRHIVVKPNARFNAYDDFFSLRLEEGEKLVDFATRVKEGMRDIHQHRDPAFDIKQLDKELQVMAIVRGLSADVSCRTLVTSLMHAEDLGDLEKLESKLVTEDIQRNKTPALYGLEKSSEGVLLAAGTLEARAHTASAASGKGKRSGAPATVLLCLSQLPATPAPVPAQPPAWAAVLRRPTAPATPTTRSARGASLMDARARATPSTTASPSASRTSRLRFALALLLATLPLLLLLPLPSLPLASSLVLLRQAPSPLLSHPQTSLTTRGTQTRAPRLI